MQTQLKQLILIPFGILLFSITGCTQVPVKEPVKEENKTVGNSDLAPVQSEQGMNISTKSTTIGPCESKLEENEVKVLMDTITAIIHVDFYCLCSDYLTDVKVKLSNRERTYERITDKLGCDFRHIQPGKYVLEVEYEAAKKFKPTEVMVMGGEKSRWKIFLCDE